MNPTEQSYGKVVPVSSSEEHPTFIRAQHHAFCPIDQLFVSCGSESSRSQLYGTIVDVDVVMLVLRVVAVSVALVVVAVVWVTETLVAVSVTEDVPLVKLTLVVIVVFVTPVRVKLVASVLEVLPVVVAVVSEAVLVEVSHPTCACLQHQAHCAEDRPTVKFPMPVEQLIGKLVVVVSVPVAVEVVRVMVGVDDTTVWVSVLVTEAAVIAAVVVAVVSVAVGSHPVPRASQHQAFFSFDHPVFLFAYPAVQLYCRGTFARRTCVVTAPPSPASHPTRTCSQHQLCFAADHDLFQSRDLDEQL